MFPVTKSLYDFKNLVILNQNIFPNNELIIRKEISANKRKLFIYRETFSVQKEPTGKNEYYIHRGNFF